MSILLTCQPGAPLRKDATSMTPPPSADAAAVSNDGPIRPVVPVIIDREDREEPEPPPPDAGRVDEVRLQLRVSPVDAEVTWGAKRLGMVKPHEPLEITRPRHSGPVDLILRAPGFVPYHTRLFTDADDRVAIDLVRPSAGSGLVEWKVKPSPRGPSRAPAARSSHH
jgi:hypothetical protein